MPEHISNELAQRLRKAEEAAAYVERLESLASEAPALRERVSLLQRMQERENHRADALERARVALDAANEAQRNLPAIIANAANLVNQLAETLRQVDTYRREATACLSVVDRMDYEDDLDRIAEPPDGDADSAPRDPQSSRMIVAARHGSARVRQLIDAMSPGFAVFAGCDLDAIPMRRELAAMIMAQLAAELEPNRPPQRRPPPAPPPVNMAEPAPAPAARDAGAAD